MELSDILLLGDQRLYEVCPPIEQHEVESIRPLVADMAALVLAFRQKYGAGRAIAAPQVGVTKRLIVMNIDYPVAIINPKLTHLSEGKMTLWDDCMSFPNLLVRLERHQSCRLHFKDLKWQDHTWELEGDLSELIQHENDHLDGILAIHRALDDHSFQWRSTPQIL